MSRSNYNAFDRHVSSDAHIAESKFAQLTVAIPSQHRNVDAPSLVASLARAGMSFHGIGAVAKDLYIRGASYTSARAALQDMSKRLKQRVARHLKNAPWVGLGFDCSTSETLGKHG